MTCKDTNKANFGFLFDWRGKKCDEKSNTIDQSNPHIPSELRTNAKICTGVRKLHISIDIDKIYTFLLNWYVDLIYYIWHI